MGARSGAEGAHELSGEGADELSGEGADELSGDDDDDDEAIAQEYAKSRVHSDDGWLQLRSAVVEKAGLAEEARREAAERLGVMLKAKVRRSEAFARWQGASSVLDDAARRHASLQAAVRTRGSASIYVKDDALRALGAPACDKTAIDKHLGEVMDVWRKKPGTVLDELCSNLREPRSKDDDAAQPASRRTLANVCVELRDEQDEELNPELQQHLLAVLCWKLSAMTDVDLDRALGFESCPEAPEAEPGSGVAALQEAAFRPYRDEHQGKRNPEVFRSLVSAAGASFQETLARGDALSSGESSAAFKELEGWAKSLCLLAATAPKLEAPKTLFRGLAGLPEQTLSELAKKEPGDTMYWPAPSSATDEESVAQTHCSQTTPVEGNVLFTIRDVGQAICLRSLSRYPDESEWLLPPLSMLEVVSVSDKRTAEPPEPLAIECVFKGCQLPEEFAEQCVKDFVAASDELEGVLQSISLEEAQASKTAQEAMEVAEIDMEQIVSEVPEAQLGEALTRNTIVDWATSESQTTAAQPATESPAAPAEDSAPDGAGSQGRALVEAGSAAPEGPRPAEDEGSTYSVGRSVALSQAAVESGEELYHISPPWRRTEAVKLLSQLKVGHSEAILQQKRVAAMLADEDLKELKSSVEVSHPAPPAELDAGVFRRLIHIDTTGGADIRRNPELAQTRADALKAQLVVAECDHSEARLENAGAEEAYLQQCCEGVDGIDLRFDIPFRKVNHADFKAELRANMMEIGASLSVLGRVEVTLVPGSTIAEIRGPASAIAELRALDLSSLSIQRRPAEVLGQPTLPEDLQSFSEEAREAASQALLDWQGKRAALQSRLTQQEIARTAAKFTILRKQSDIHHVMLEQCRAQVQSVTAAAETEPLTPQHMSFLDDVRDVAEELFSEWQRQKDLLKAELRAMDDLQKHVDAEAAGQPDLAKRLTDARAAAADDITAFQKAQGSNAQVLAALMDLLDGAAPSDRRPLVSRQALATLSAEVAAEIQSEAMGEQVQMKQVLGQISFRSFEVAKAGEEAGEAAGEEAGSVLQHAGSSSASSYASHLLPGTSSSGAGRGSWGSQLLAASIANKAQTNRGATATGGSEADGLFHTLQSFLENVPKEPGAAAGHPPEGTLSGHLKGIAALRAAVELRSQLSRRRKKVESQARQENMRPKSATVMDPLLMISTTGEIEEHPMRGTTRRTTWSGEPRKRRGRERQLARMPSRSDMTASQEAVRMRRAAERRAYAAVPKMESAAFVQSSLSYLNSGEQREAENKEEEDEEDQAVLPALLRRQKKASRQSLKDLVSDEEEDSEMDLAEKEDGDDHEESEEYDMHGWRSPHRSQRGFSLASAPLHYQKSLGIVHSGRRITGIAIARPPAAARRETSKERLESQAEGLAVFSMDSVARRLNSAGSRTLVAPSVVRSEVAFAASEAVVQAIEEGTGDEGADGEQQEDHADQLDAARPSMLGQRDGTGLGIEVQAEGLNHASIVVRPGEAVREAPRRSAAGAGPRRGRSPIPGDRPRRGRVEWLQGVLQVLKLKRQGNEEQSSESASQASEQEQTREDLEQAIAEFEAKLAVAEEVQADEGCSGEVRRQGIAQPEDELARTSEEEAAARPRKVRFLIPRPKVKHRPGAKTASSMARRVAPRHSAPLPLLFQTVGGTVGQLASPMDVEHGVGEFLVAGTIISGTQAASEMEHQTGFLSDSIVERLRESSEEEREQASASGKPSPARPAPPKQQAPAPTAPPSKGSPPYSAGAMEGRPARRRSGPPGSAPTASEKEEEERRGKVSSSRVLQSRVSSASDATERDVASMMERLRPPGSAIIPKAPDSAPSPLQAQRLANRRMAKPRGWTLTSAVLPAAAEEPQRSRQQPAADSGWSRQTSQDPAPEFAAKKAVAEDILPTSVPLKPPRTAPSPRLSTKQSKDMPSSRGQERRASDSLPPIAIAGLKNDFSQVSFGGGSGVSGPGSPRLPPIETFMPASAREAMWHPELLRRGLDVFSSGPFSARQGRSSNRVDSQSRHSTASPAGSDYYQPRLRGSQSLERSRSPAEPARSWSPRREQWSPQTARGARGSHGDLSPKGGAWLDRERDFLGQRGGGSWLPMPDLEYAAPSRASTRRRGRHASPSPDRHGGAPEGRGVLGHGFEPVLGGGAARALPAAKRPKATVLSSPKAQRSPDVLVPNTFEELRLDRVWAQLLREVKPSAPCPPGAEPGGAAGAGRSPPAASAGGVVLDARARSPKGCLESGARLRRASPQGKIRRPADPGVEVKSSPRLPILGTQLSTPRLVCG